MSAANTLLVAAASGLTPWKGAVRTIALSNITLSGTQTVSGVSLVGGDRCAVAGQSAGKNNGIYVVSAGAWARATDMSSSQRTPPGSSFVVLEGTYADTTWRLSSPTSQVRLGVDSLTFSQVAVGSNVPDGATSLAGTADATLTVAGGKWRYLDATTLNAHRTFTLSLTGAAAGDQIRITRVGVSRYRIKVETPAGGVLWLNNEGDLTFQVDAAGTAWQVREAAVRQGWDVLQSAAVYPDDNTQDSQSGLAALLLLSRWYADVVLPFGTYYVGSTVSITEGRGLRGQKSTNTTQSTRIQARSGFSGTYVVECTGNNAVLTDVTIDCDEIATSGLRLQACTGRSDINNIQVLDPVGTGISIESCQVERFGKMYVQGTIGGHGFHIVDCNNSRFECLTANNTGPAVFGARPVLIEGDNGSGSGADSGGCVIENLYTDNKWECHAEVIGTSTPVVIHASWSETGDNTLLLSADGVRCIDAHNVVVRDQFLGHAGHGTFPTAFAQYSTDVASETIDGTTTRIAQRFVLAATTRIDRACLKLATDSSFVGTVRIETDSAGDPSGTLADADLEVTGWTPGTTATAARAEMVTPGDEFTDTEVELSAGTYWLVVTRTSGSATFDGTGDGTADQVKVYNGSWANSANIENMMVIVGVMNRAVRLINSDECVIDSIRSNGSLGGVTTWARVRLEGTSTLNGVRSPHYTSTSAPADAGIEDFSTGRNECQRRQWGSTSGAPAWTGVRGDIAANLGSSTDMALYRHDGTGWVGISPSRLISSSQVAIRVGTADTGSDDVVRFTNESGVRVMDCPQSNFVIRITTNGFLRDNANATLLQWNNTGLGFFAATPIAKPTVTGAHGSNAALQSLLTALANLGLITDSSS